MKRTFLIATLLVCFACRQTTESTSDAVATTSTGSSDVEASVTFSGLVTHFLDTYQRAVVVYATGHRRTVRLPITTDIKTIVEGNLGGKCTTTCNFDVNYMSMQLLDGTKAALSGDLQSADGTFTSIVTKLSDAHSTAFDKAKLHAEATGAVTANSLISWGHFDLHGGDASATAFKCLAKFEPGTGQPFIKFPNKVTVTYKLPGGAFLRVIDSSGKQYDLPLPGPKVLIEVDNDMSTATSHFQEYAKLSTDNPTLPKIILDEEDTCKGPIIESGGVPGCSNTLWP